MVTELQALYVSWKMEQKCLRTQKLMLKFNDLFKRMSCIDIVTSYSRITLQQDDVWMEFSDPQVFSRFFLVHVCAKLPF